MINSTPTKTLIAILTAALLAVAPGCATKPGSPNNVATICPLVQSAATIGTTFTLASYPQYKPAFVTARDGLTLLIAQSSGQPITAAQLGAILSELPVKQLQGTNNYSILISAGGLSLLNLVSKEITALDKNGSLTNSFAPIAMCIRDGITAGLGQ